ncbi:hypothetical protein D3C78_1752910 [compost metagenome]
MAGDIRQQRNTQVLIKRTAEDPPFAAHQPRAHTHRAFFPIGAFQIPGLLFADVDQG